MKLTPLDIRQKRFEGALRGYQRHQVEAFLELLASEFEEVVKENISLKEELRRVSLKLETHQDRERTLQETLVTAQRCSEDLQQAAKKEADIVLAQAEQQAERIVLHAHQKLVQVVEDINELKRQRVQFESQVRSVVDAHLKLLETFRPDFAEKEWERIEDNVAFLSQKKASGDS
ncbi:MAG: DivIVA domain-containing protein [Myxococcaceae bacterium]